MHTLRVVREFHKGWGGGKRRLARTLLCMKQENESKGTTLHRRHVQCRDKLKLKKNPTRNFSSRKWIFSKSINLSMFGCGAVVDVDTHQL